MKKKFAILFKTLRKNFKRLPNNLIYLSKCFLERWSFRAKLSPIRISKISFSTCSQEKFGILNFFIELLSNYFWFLLLIQNATIFPIQWFLPKHKKISWLGLSQKKHGKKLINGNTMKNSLTFYFRFLWNRSSLVQMLIMECIQMLILDLT